MLALTLNPFQPNAYVNIRLSCQMPLLKPNGLSGQQLIALAMQRPIRVICEYDTMFSV
jgi:hypothetical protein